MAIHVLHTGGGVTRDLKGLTDDYPCDNLFQTAINK